MLEAAIALRMAEVEAVGRDEDLPVLREDHVLGAELAQDQAVLAMDERGGARQSSLWFDRADHEITYFPIHSPDRI